MKILVIGNGGREHAIIEKCLESHHKPELFCAPGIDAIANKITNVNISASDNAALLDFVKKNEVDITIVGPEAPLVNGIVDLFEANALKIFGPQKSAAELENSKAFSKDIMLKYNVPTAAYKVFNEAEEAKSYIRTRKTYPIVIKASGLAGGKGVVIPESETEAMQYLDEIMNDKIFGESGDKVVIEDFLTGEEASIFAFCDGNDFKIISSSQDHKRIGEADTGKNTGGMGAYAPAPVANSKVIEFAAEQIIRPTLEGMKNEGRIYKGVLFCGLMIENNQANVVEFNVRLGDPETQVVLPLIKSDFVDLIVACIDEDLKSYNLELEENQSCMTVVLASGGYPEYYEKGYEITGTDTLSEAYINYAGTKIENNILLTNGGRVLNVTSKQKTINECAKAIYTSINKIHFKNMYYRKDIGHRILS